MKRVNRNFLAETSKSNRISLCMARFFDYNVEKLIGGKTMLPDSYRQDATRIRRDLHKIPESGFHEFQTQAYIMRFLQELGLQGEPIAQTGVACFFDMGQSSAIAFRADMDGLCITERTAHDFQSETTGIMHACGHDGHMTMLLLLAKYLSENPIQISKNILLIFQPAEEGPGGAKVVIEEGVLQRFHVEHVFGFHLSPDYPFGTVAFTDGNFCIRR
jgi:hippurate hydrolase